MESTYSINYPFLVEILGMTDYCNLNCDYCDWEKSYPEALTEEESIHAKQNLTAVKIFIRNQYPQAQMIEYSGGEPYMYPKIVKELLETFPEYWVRIVTNGLLLNENDFNALLTHGKAYLAISLDGETIQKNYNRFHEQILLDRIIANIDRALRIGIPVMLLCTLNRDNINGFPAYLRWISEKWDSYIENGQLVLPAHIITEYQRRHRVIRESQWAYFQTRLGNIQLPAYLRIKEHYRAMFQPEHVCNIYRWAASMHFLHRSIVTDGQFTSYRCGMRGIGKIGEFQVKSEVSDNTFTRKIQEHQTDFRAFRCHCFVDWTAFDLIFEGKIPLDRAKKWFVLFRDRNVIKWIEQYQQIRKDEEQVKADELAPEAARKRKTAMGFDSNFFRKNIDAVFFDLYGTLMEDRHELMSCKDWGTFEQFLGYQGAIYQRGELADVFFGLVKKVREQSNQHIDPGREFCEAEVFRQLYILKGITASEQLVNTTAQVFRACSTEYCRLYEGAKELLLALKKAGKVICLLSNAQRIYTEPELRMTGIYGCFDEIRLSSDYGVKKPDRRFYRDLINWTQLPPQRILMVGNDAVEDIQPARKLQMYTCYIHSNLSSEELPPPCNIYLEGANLIELQHLLLGEPE